MIKKTKKILIFGADGLLGQELEDHFKGSPDSVAVGLGHDQADITDQKSMTLVLKREKPDVIINCAARINVEFCEGHPLEAWQVNAFGPGLIANSLFQLGLVKTLFIQMSTSDVFGNEKKAFREDDYPNPVNVYGRSKLEGEKILEAEAKVSGLNYYIVRTSWLYSPFKESFVDAVVSGLKKKENFLTIDDQWSVITRAADLVISLNYLIRHQNHHPSGVYHLVNQSSGGLSKYTIAKSIARFLKLDQKYLKKVSRKRMLKTDRPKSALLLNTKLPQLPNWQNSLKEYLDLKYGTKK
jgi:dTDP-4-dehydrorhamnose reductase